MYENIEALLERWLGEDGCKPCHCWLACLVVLACLLGIGLGLVLGGVVGDETALRALSFLPFWLVGLAAIPCWVYCVAARYSDDDDWGCGVGDYDEGPGNMGCAITSVILCWCVFAGAGGSVAAIVVGASPNSTSIV